MTPLLPLFTRCLAETASIDPIPSTHQLPSPGLPSPPPHCPLPHRCRPPPPPPPPLSPPHYLLSQQLPTGISRSVSSLRFSSRGHLLAASAADGSVRLYPVLPSPTAPLSPHPTLLTDAHEGGINEVSFSADDRQLCSASDDKTLVLWDVETATPLRTLRGHSSYVFCCAFTPASSLLLSGSYDESVKLWDLRQQRPARTLAAHSEAVTAVDCKQGQQAQAVSSSYDGLCRVWDLTTGACLRTIYVDKVPATSSARFTPNGKFVLTSYLDGCIRLWDYTTGTMVKQYEGHVNAAWCCATGFLVTHRKKYVVGGSEDGRLYVWDIQSREVVQRLDVGKAGGGGGAGGGGVVAKVGSSGAGVCLALTCHPTRHVMVSSVTVDGGQGSALSVFTDNDSELVIAE